MVNNQTIRILISVLIIVSLFIYMMMMINDRDGEIEILKNDAAEIRLELIERADYIRTAEEERQHLDVMQYQKSQALFQANATAHTRLENMLKLLNDQTRTAQFLEHDVQRLEELYRRVVESQMILERKASELEHAIVPIVVLTCNRSFYLSKCLTALEKSRNQSTLPRHYHPIIVSQDCDDMLTDNILYRDDDEFLAMDLVAWRHPNRTKLLYPYQSISRHYRWVLEEVFKLGYSTAIIIEDDLQVSPDFISYFDRMHPLLLDSKQNLFCVSAWNDFGQYNTLPAQPETVLDQFRRTDFFPGLGWMLTRTFWLEIRDHWPESYWDEYLRQKNITHGRHCIYPDIPRVKNLGELGTSGETIFNNHLSKMISNNITINYQNISIFNLFNENYKKEFEKEFTVARYIQFYEIETFKLKNETLKVFYTSVPDYSHYANIMGILNDTREGIPRSSYNNIVRIYYKSNILFLAPINSFG
ncbi:GlcNAc transferase [Cavenderia fasciculata]|uniref:alpha-1,3-mannosyl-glycoprotein 2-beta-N-acetylglucosaminyltransferase n=1 Tax=Cavenderia fasciculata TaxID=261658 RepID=F4PZE4_CACFS|nr:GlcNAc transferase [Cavenderia fasciculata]EGG19173.1 GlcNAc transferase [Cavenderia fasciculata]|eukprot:XP_004366806.1 GlcNAc transferase [Cavenderia fasciculata]